MPIYEYACPDCGHRFERMQRMSDDPVKLCPECGQEQVKKLISMTSFVLKGEGWYKDHYGLKQGGGDGATAPKVEGGKPDAAKPEGGKTEAAKPEGGKTEGGKTDGGKTESPARKEAAPSASSAPAASGPTGGTSSAGVS